jgi:hypothetical protein
MTHVWLVTFKTEPDWPHLGSVKIDGVYLDGGKAYDRYNELKHPDQRNEWAEVVQVEVKDAQILRN